MVVRNFDSGRQGAIRGTHDALCTPTLFQARTDVYYMYFDWFGAMHGYIDHYWRYMR